LHGRDVRAVWADLLARADAGEFPFTTFDLIARVHGAFYGPFWFELADLLAELAAGTVTSLPAAQQELAHDPFRAILCQDWFLPLRNYDEFASNMRRLKRIAPDMRYSPLAVLGPIACLGTPTPINNPQHRLSVRGSRTLLLPNSLHDPATGYSWATNAARQLGRSAVLLTYEGWGHIVYGRRHAGREPPTAT
jgi:hypothetical protein